MGGEEGSSEQQQQQDVFEEESHLFTSAEVEELHHLSDPDLSTAIHTAVHEVEKEEDEEEEEKEEEEEEEEKEEEVKTPPNFSAPDLSSSVNNLVPPPPNTTSSPPPALVTTPLPDFSTANTIHDAVRAVEKEEKEHETTSSVTQPLVRLIFFFLKKTLIFVLTFIGFLFFLLHAFFLNACLFSRLLTPLASPPPPLRSPTALIPLFPFLPTPSRRPLRRRPRGGPSWSGPAS